MTQFSGGKAVDLKGKVSIVTGGGTGIGEAITRRFIACGARVCIAGRRREMLDEVAKSLPRGSVKICAADVSDEEDVERILKTALSFEGGLHVLVNNAAIDQDPPAGVMDMDVAKWRKMLEVNLTGPFLMMKACIPQMIKAGGGSVINISSLAGLRCISENPGFCASKGGLINLTQQAALDYGRYNVRCNVVCPGATKTDMFTENMEAFAKMVGTNVQDVFARFMKDVPLPRVALPDEMAGICAFLASDDSSFLTATAIPVDGGAAVVDVSGAVISNIVRGLKK
jgi:meso-butanediol dehydrogenase / (S,S)-butanediol dehydrogenase / diacetyl reductase